MGLGAFFSSFEGDGLMQKKLDASLKSHVLVRILDVPKWILDLKFDVICCTKMALMM